MKKLRFYPKAHTYWVGRTKLDSVTTWIGKFFEPFDEKGIAKRVAYWKRKKGEKATMTSVIKGWKEQTRQGSLVHDALEKYILNEPWTLEGMDDYAKPRFKAGFEYLNVRLPPKDLQPEFRIFSENLRLAGTIDIMHELDENVVDLYDWKTNRNMTKDKIKKYELQLSVYAYMLEKEYGKVVRSLTIIHLKEDGYEEIEVPYLKSKVEEMLLSDGRLTQEQRETE